MPPRRALTATLVIAWSLPSSVGAQEPAPAGEDLGARVQALERQLEEQRRLLDELRLELSRPPAPPPPDGADAPPALTPEWGWKDGVFVRGAVGELPYELRLIGRVQLDHRVYARTASNAAVPHAIPRSRFLVRRARIGLSGAISDFGFLFEADPSRNGLPLGQFFFQYQRFEAVRLRFGHIRAPFAHENGVLGTNRLPFLERSMIIGSGNAAAAAYAPGAMILGSLDEGLFSYWLAAQNQVDSNEAVTSDPMVSARVETAFSGVVLGASATWMRRGDRSQQSITGVTPAQHRFFAPVDVRGWDQRYGLDAACFRGPFFVMAEYALVHQEREKVLASGEDGAAFLVQGAYLGAGVLFWGPARGVPHARPFQGWTLLPDADRPRQGRFAGAELVARVEWLELDDGRGRRFGGPTAAPSRAANATNIKGTDARAVTVGLNVFPLENVRLSLHWSRVRVGDQGRAAHDRTRYDDEVIMRAQIDF